MFGGCGGGVNFIEDGYSLKMSERNLPENTLVLSHESDFLVERASRFILMSVSCYINFIIFFNLVRCAYTR